ncbi:MULTISPECIES: RNA polymerase sigma factor [unclassified Streptomyces]|uniref:RNA polymerase sigma factor n=1 Tax=unclassified Streptomyces TaxID=2593676 RepID=UPI001F035772|nr:MULTISPECIES: sigma-70 family RNA polymerase sigma factor [unclassified Streptomyces]MCH0565605.1 sigma-70 family RNA polymerase sigma factor [Streptomyces sp. MUM 2J]MCH0572128.1 sigma-70 family RNA polymerase sigma factor [Streptomyces sp. MUM 136J]
MKHDLLAALRPLLAAEARAEAHALGTDPGDLEQEVWLRLLERLAAGAPPSDPHRWLRRVVRLEARRTRRTRRLERPYGTEPADSGDRDPERLALTLAARRALRDTVRRLPGRCPGLLEALLSPRDLTYREIAGELGISQGSLGPERSRCLECLRRLLTPEVAAREARG